MAVPIVDLFRGKFHLLLLREAKDLYLLYILSYLRFFSLSTSILGDSHLGYYYRICASCSLELISLYVHTPAFSSCSGWISPFSLNTSRPISYSKMADWFRLISQGYVCILRIFVFTYLTIYLRLRGLSTWASFVYAEGR